MSKQVNMIIHTLQTFIYHVVNKQKRETIKKTLITVLKKVLVLLFYIILTKQERKTLYQITNNSIKTNDNVVELTT